MGVWSVCVHVSISAAHMPAEVETVLIISVMLETELGVPSR